MKLKFPVLLLTAFFACIIFSCNKNNNSTPAKVKIIGKWEVKRVEIYAFVDGAQKGGDTILITPLDYIHMEFKKNMEFSLTQSSGGQQETTQGTYTLSGNKLKITGQDTGGYDSTMNYTYKINNGQLLLTDTESITSNDNGESHSLKTVVNLWLDKLP